MLVIDRASPNLPAKFWAKYQWKRPEVIASKIRAKYQHQYEPSGTSYRHSVSVCTYCAHCWIISPSAVLWSADCHIFGAGAVSTMHVPNSTGTATSSRSISNAATVRARQKLLYPGYLPRNSAANQHHHGHQSSKISMFQPRKAAKFCCKISSKFGLTLTGHAQTDQTETSPPQTSLRTWKLLCDLENSVLQLTGAFSGYYRLICNHSKVAWCCATL